MPETIRFMLLTEHRSEVETYPGFTIVMQELIFCLPLLPMTSSLSQLSKMRLLPLFYGSRAANGVVVITTRKRKTKAKQM